MENPYRWQRPLKQSIAYRLFKHHHTLLNKMYWAHAPASTTIKRLCKEQQHVKNTPLDFFTVHDEDDRRIASSWSIWQENYSHFLAMTRLNFLLDVNSYFETYLIKIFSLAMESRPDVIILRPQKVDGLVLLKNYPGYRLNDDRHAEYLFHNQLLSLTKGEWSRRGEAFYAIFGEVPTALAQSIAKLDEIRKIRNSVGHSFGRTLNEVCKIKLISEDNVIGISEERLKEVLQTIDEVTLGIDEMLTQKFIGAYEFAAFYVQLFGKASCPKAQSLAESPKVIANNFIAHEAKKCRQVLGVNGYHPISVCFSESIIGYYWFDI